MNRLSYYKALNSSAHTEDNDLKTPETMNVFIIPGEQGRNVVRISMCHLLRVGLDAVHRRAGPEVTLTLSATALVSVAAERGSLWGGRSSR